MLNNLCTIMLKSNLGFALTVNFVIASMAKMLLSVNSVIARHEAILWIDAKAVKHNFISLYCLWTMPSNILASFLKIASLRSQ